MKLHTMVEIAILAVFVIVVLAFALGWNPVRTPQVEEGLSKEDYMQRGDRFYEAGASGYNRASIEYWEALKLDENIPRAHFRLANIYYSHTWNYEALNELEKLKPRIAS